MSDGSEYQPDGKNRESAYVPPETLAEMAEQLKEKGNIGVAFTYNEPMISYEYVVDTAKLLREKNLNVVLVTNGCVSEKTADAVLPVTDALNIDLKSFRDDVYRRTLGGDLEAVKRFIRKANECCHVELTSLIVPGMNDSEKEILEMTRWIASLPKGEEIPLHITRFFPRYRVLNKKPTERALVLHLADVAGERLKYVYPGNL
jgi:pyruvate formate lyase activating enzyme